MAEYKIGMVFRQGGLQGTAEDTVSGMWRKMRRTPQSFANVPILVDALHQGNGLHNVPSLREFPAQVLEAMGRAVVDHVWKFVNQIWLRILGLEIPTHSSCMNHSQDTTFNSAPPGDNQSANSWRIDPQDKQALPEQSQWPKCGVQLADGWSNYVTHIYMAVTRTQHG